MILRLSDAAFLSSIGSNDYWGNWASQNYGYEAFYFIDWWGS
jgi:hypothetical protein